MPAVLLEGSGVVQICRRGLEQTLITGKSAIAGGFAGRINHDHGGNILMNIHRKFQLGPMDLAPGIIQNTAAFVSENVAAILIVMNVPNLQQSADFKFAALGRDRMFTVVTALIQGRVDRLDRGFGRAVVVQLAAQVVDLFAQIFSPAFGHQMSAAYGQRKRDRHSTQHAHELPSPDVTHRIPVDCLDSGSA